MKNFFLGFLFIFLNFTISINQHTIHLLPDFMGYYFLLRGIDEMKEGSAYFSKARPFAFGMMLYTLLLFLLDLSGLTSLLSGSLPFAILLGLIAVIFHIYVAYLITKGILETEEAQQQDLNGAAIYSKWKIMMICMLLGSFFALLAPALATALALTLALNVAALVMNVLFLMAVYRGMRLWENPEEEEDPEDFPKEEDFYTEEVPKDKGLHTEEVPKERDSE